MISVTRSAPTSHFRRDHDPAAIIPRTKETPSIYIKEKKRDNRFLIEGHVPPRVHDVSGDGELIISSKSRRTSRVVGAPPLPLIYRIAEIGAISERRRETRSEKERNDAIRRASNDPLFPAKNLDDVIDNYEMIREA